MIRKTKKGEEMEELLRLYFLKAGYYVARGVPFSYQGFDVTDIDLWMYGRSSSVSREIAIVDIKNKKTPQALERIFWVKGLQSAVGANNALVATTDKRPEVKEFGKVHDVVVLDGHFVSRLSKSEGILKSRLKEEELVAEIENYTLGKIDGDWKGRYIESRKYLTKELSFDSCNFWLEQGRYFAEQVSLNGNNRLIAYRLCFLVCSYIAIAVDYILREMSFSEGKYIEKNIDNGFKYGSRGYSGTKNILDTMQSLADSYSDNGNAVIAQVRSNLEMEYSTLPTSILSEYLSKSDVSKHLFGVSLELETLAMRRDGISYSSSSKELRSLVGCFLDYWQIDRRKFADA